MRFAIAALTSVHVVLSLVGIGAGFVVVFGLLAARRLDGWARVRQFARLVVFYG